MLRIFSLWSAHLIQLWAGKSVVNYSYVSTVSWNVFFYICYKCNQMILPSYVQLRDLCFHVLKLWSWVWVWMCIDIGIMGFILYYDHSYSGYTAKSWLSAWISPFLFCVDRCLWSLSISFHLNLIKSILFYALPDSWGNRCITFFIVLFSPL